MRLCLAFILTFFTFFNSFPQVDTTLIFNPSAPFGPLDIRTARSASEYYFLEEDVTFSFRSRGGIETNSYLDMTAWDSDTYLQGNMRLRREDGSDKFIMNYRYLRPANYDDDYRHGYPLVIVLHGLHESGNCARNKCYHATTAYDPGTNVPKAPVSDDEALLNNDYNLIHGGLNYLEAHRMAGSSLPDDPSLSPHAFPGFVVFPQNLNGWDVNAAEDAIRLVRLLMRNYNVDANQIYINGISNGGHGAYEVLKRAPWLFAAGVLFSAADDASITAQRIESSIAGVPLWIFQGGIDELPTQNQTEGYIKRFRDAGANIRYTLYEQIGHGTWNKAFSEADFFSWMLRQQKNNIHVFADNPIICSTSGDGPILAMPSGYHRYEWEFNGISIVSADRQVYVAEVPGAYRGRFKMFGASDDDWNEWSRVITVSERIVEPAKVKQFGTVVLKDPNGANEAKLEAEGSHAHYYWFRNGVRINFPGNADDTFKIARFESRLDDGLYSVQVADYNNCLSPPSKGISIFFDDRAPISLPTPETFKVTIQSPSEVFISWDDISRDESGFEVWRRELKDTTASSWSMAALTMADATSFEDINLSPSSSYEYMIRAVNDSGRSDYTEALIIKTDDDLAPPSAPTRLTAEITGVETIKLTWNRSHDNSSIKEYVIFSGNDSIHSFSPDTTFLLSDFQINAHYSFYVKAVDRGNNLSASSNYVDVYTRISGLFYQHSTGEWNSLEEIDWNIQEFTGVADSISLASRTQEDFFNFRFDGYITIEKNGVYQFRLSSNDGSRLFMDDSLLIVNDGIHNLATITAPVQVLSDGPHRITVDFFDNVLVDTLNVEYKGPDSQNKWISIPSYRFMSAPPPEETDVSIGHLEFQMYPNPLVQRELRMLLFNSSSDAIVVRVLSETGQLIYKQIIAPLESNGRKEIVLTELHTLQNGVYFIRLEQNKYSRTKKFIILK
jgi:hypothetical protein